MKILNSKINNSQAGFTLIELVVVIVILGILAATAAPKFIDLTGDARGSVVDAVRGSVNSAADMAHSKALIAGQTGATGSITVSGVAVGLVYGWPSNATIDDMITIDGDITYAVANGQATFTHASATDGTACLTTYTETTDTNVRPTITSVITGC